MIGFSIYYSSENSYRYNNADSAIGNLSEDEEFDNHLRSLPDRFQGFSPLKAVSKQRIVVVCLHFDIYLKFNLLRCGTNVCRLTYKFSE